MLPLIKYVTFWIMKKGDVIMSSGIHCNKEKIFYKFELLLSCIIDNFFLIQLLLRASMTILSMEALSFFSDFVHSFPLFVLSPWLIKPPLCSHKSSHVVDIFDLEYHFL